MCIKRLTDQREKDLQHPMKDSNRKTEMTRLPLKDSELRYRRLFEAAQDGILILDADTGMITDGVIWKRPSNASCCGHHGNTFQ